MHADSQAGRRFCSLHRFRERWPICKQGSAGYDAATKGIEDPPIDSLCPTQVICVDDKILHDLSCFGDFPVRTYSYSFARPYIFVPLTLPQRNSSMAF